MMRGMADGHPFADLDANDDGAVELTRSGRTAASLSTCPVRPPSSVKRCYGTPNCIGGGAPGVGVNVPRICPCLRQNAPCTRPTNGLQLGS